MEEWKQDKLIDLLDSLIDYRGKTPRKVDKGIPLITAKIVKNGRIDTPTEFLDIEDYDNWMVRGFPKNGDVILTTEAPLGEVAQLDDNKIALAQRIVCLRGKKGVLDNTFLKYFLLSSLGQARLKARETGTTVTGIKQSELKEVLIDYPPYKYQKQITSILKSFDDKIELNRRINENLEQQAQALFKSWFVDFEPFKDGKFVDSELGMIPEGWRVGVLADIANITMGQSPKGTSYNEIGDGISFYQGRAEFGNRFPSVRLFTTEPSRYAEPYSVLLSVRAPVGDINIAVERCCIGRGLASILSKNKHQSFVLYTMFFLKKELDKFNSEGTVFGSINRSSLENLKIIIPPVDIIDKFENLTSKIDVMLLNLFQETTSLAQLRDTLLPRLMSGKLEIKDNSYD